mmetsp:Transcript_54561/g.128899  ORF Transcript_54561/g.128899 Transcript_54561/m.128899 type:complete len:189 (+) Transcript_54561:1-567(+)
MDELATEQATITRLNAAIARLRDEQVEIEQRTAETEDTLRADIAAVEAEEAELESAVMAKLGELREAKNVLEAKTTTLQKRVDRNSELRQASEKRINSLEFELDSARDEHAMAMEQVEQQLADARAALDKAKADKAEREAAIETMQQQLKPEEEAPEAVETVTKTTTAPVRGAQRPPARGRATKGKVK